jgi:hypothetical protein
VTPASDYVATSPNWVLDQDGGTEVGPTYDCSGATAHSGEVIESRRSALSQGRQLLPSRTAVFLAVLIVSIA